MTWTIRTERACASNDATFFDRSHTVILRVNEQAICTCSYHLHNKSNCKHIERIWERGCLSNPNFYFGNGGSIKPIKYNEEARGFNKKEKCTMCDGPTILVDVIEEKYG